jgi:uncharacterized Zn-finger protein
LRLFHNASALLCWKSALRPGMVAADIGAGQTDMTDNIVPHFHNDIGVAVVEIGAREFMCEGAIPPFDHPHVYCDMGDDTEYVCPYCSTLYRHDPTLAPSQARPAECALKSDSI